jgi:hypothetical protein
VTGRFLLFLFFTLLFIQHAWKRLAAPASVVDPDCTNPKLLAGFRSRSAIGLWIRIRIQAIDVKKLCWTCTQELLIYWTNRIQKIKSHFLLKNVILFSISTIFQPVGSDPCSKLSEKLDPQHWRKGTGSKSSSMWRK